MTVNIDGSMGEGGGQVLRSALALSLVTGKAFTIENIRAGRKKPGLMRQHLTAVKAATAVGSATVEGAELRSQRLVFEPNTVTGGEYHFSVGSAGSATLVLQTVLPPLLVADEPSDLVLEGGTHNPWAPPFCFLKKAFLPLIEKMGPTVTATLDQHGFYPAGGGRFRVSIDPTPSLQGFSLLERGEKVQLQARCLLANLPLHIANRELKVVKKKLGLTDDQATVEFIKDPRGPGNVLLAEATSAGLTEVFIGFGERGVRAEAVAERVCKDVRRYMAAQDPVGVYLADQLLLPLAMAGSGSFRTVGLTPHAKTNIEVIEKFLDVHVTCQGEDGAGWLITVAQA